MTKSESEARKHEIAADAERKIGKTVEEWCESGEFDLHSRVRAIVKEALTSYEEELTGTRTIEALSSSAHVERPQPDTKPRAVLAEIPPFLVVRRRDAYAPEVWEFHDEQAARRHFDSAQAQWTSTFLCRVIQRGMAAPAATPDVVCQHGTAMDVHCCNCHSGFLFDSDSCVCALETSPSQTPEEHPAVETPEVMTTCRCGQFDMPIDAMKIKARNGGVHARHTCCWGVKTQEVDLSPEAQPSSAPPDPIVSAMGEKQEERADTELADRMNRWLTEPLRDCGYCGLENPNPLCPRHKAQPSPETPASLECDQCGARSEHYPNMPRNVGDRCPSGSSCDGSMVSRADTPEPRKDAE
jgi:hypothetical protein